MTDLQNTNNDSIKKIPLHRLQLDQDNPRLPASLERTQDKMLDYIASTTAIEELMEAIAENDFFSGEPLVVVKASDDHHFIVVEGNRRLTALKLLQDTSIYSSPGNRMLEIVKQAKYKPIEVPVIESPTRPDVLSYLGFRHITGIKEWKPLAKARYIEQLFNLTSASHSAKQRYTEVGRSIGSRRDHIKRNLDALAIYNIIEKNDFYEIKGLNEKSFKFAVLSTAIADERISCFIGVQRRDTNGNTTPLDPIVDNSTIDTTATEELTEWLFQKDDKGKTRVGESRNLRTLAAVVNSPAALKSFRHGSPLNIAYQQTADLSKDFLGILYQVEGSLAEAASMVATVEFDENALNVARRVSEHIKLIGRELKSKNEADDDF